MAHEDEDIQKDQSEDAADSVLDEKNAIRRVKPKDQGVILAEDQKEGADIYDGTLEQKAEESEQHDDLVVEEVDHDAWGEEPDYGHQYEQETADNEVATGEAIYTPEGREELLEDDEITAEEAFYMEGRDKVFKRKREEYTDNPEMQEQWKDD
ncbi:MAG: hypothetical protein ACXVIG_01240 [Halobacteriota archaeon]